jgi:hypothetical protein
MRAKQIDQLTNCKHIFHKSNFLLTKRRKNHPKTPILSGKEQIFSHSYCSYILDEKLFLTLQKLEKFYLSFHKTQTPSALKKTEGVVLIASEVNFYTLPKYSSTV